MYVFLPEHVSLPCSNVKIWQSASSTLLHDIQYILLPIITQVSNIFTFNGFMTILLTFCSDCYKSNPVDNSVTSIAVHSSIKSINKSN